MERLAGSGPNRARSASHRLDVRPYLALSGRLVAEGEVARDHMQDKLIHRVVETERSFWRNSRGHADDQAGVQIDSARGYPAGFASRAPVIAPARKRPNLYFYAASGLWLTSAIAAVRYIVRVRRGSGRLRSD